MTPEEKLRMYAHPAEDEDDRWWLTAPDCTHTSKSTLAIIDACLTLDVPVTDVFTSGMWLAMVDRVALLQMRVSELEAAVAPPNPEPPTDAPPPQ